MQNALVLMQCCEFILVRISRHQISPPSPPTPASPPLPPACTSSWDLSFCNRQETTSSWRCSWKSSNGKSRIKRLSRKACKQQKSFSCSGYRRKIRRLPSLQIGSRTKRRRSEDSTIRLVGPSVVLFLKLGFSPNMGYPHGSTRRFLLDNPTRLELRPNKKENNANATTKKQETRQPYSTR